MNVKALCPLPGGSILWQRQGKRVLTVVCKATFNLQPGESTLSQKQDPLHPADVHFEDDPGHSAQAPSDLVPFKARADVVLVGYAFTPNGEPARHLVVRMIVGDLDKAFAVVGDQAWAQDGALRQGQPFTRMPLRYERAGGGPDTTNPVGVDPDAPPDSYGMVRLPNLQPQSFVPLRPGEIIVPVGFGPLSGSWPARREKLGRAGTLPDRWDLAPLPADLDPAYFNCAPRDQQMDGHLRDNERLVLENLHPQHPRLATNLHGLRPRAFTDRGEGPQEISLGADTLWIDTGRAICTVTWRGYLESPPADVSVVVAMEGPSQPLPWAEVQKAARKPEPHRAPTLPFIGRPAAGAPPDPSPHFGAPPPGAATGAWGTQSALRPEQGAAGGLPFSKPSRPDPLVATSSEAAPMGDASPAWLQGRAAQPSGHPPAPPPSAPALGVTPPSAPAPIGAADLEDVVATTMSGSELSAAVMAVLPFRELSRGAPVAPPPVAPPVVPVQPPPVVPVLPPPVAPPVAGSPWAAGLSASAVVVPTVAPVVAPAPSAPVVATAAPSAPAASTSAPVLRSAGSSGVPGGAAAASDAAAGASARAAGGARPAAPAPAPDKSPRAATGDVLDLLWYDEREVPRIRAWWEELVTELDFEGTDPRRDPGAEDPDKARGRHNVFGVMSDGAVIEPSAVPRVIAEAVNEKGRFTPPLALVGGELRFPFDEVETLKATIVAMTPHVGGDKKLKESLDSMSELLKTPYLQGSTGVVPKLTRDLREQFREPSRSLPAGYLDTHVERLLLEQRRYSIRKVFGGEFIRALLGGGEATIPVYLPKQLDQTLPILVVMKARLIVEAHLQQDTYEASPHALRAVALGRSFPLDGWRSAAAPPS